MKKGGAASPMPDHEHRRLQTRIANPLAVNQPLDKRKTRRGNGASADHDGHAVTRRVDAKPVSP